MSSKSISISNYGQALEDGLIPGEFNDDWTTFTFPTVESTSLRGAKLVWKIIVSIFDKDDKLESSIPFTDEMLEPKNKAPGVVGKYIMESHQVSADGVRGKTRALKKPTYIRKGKNLTRSNATNPATQALRDALSKYNSKKKRAAVQETRENKVLTPVGDRPPPMLVKKEDQTHAARLTKEVFANGVTVQRKFNGVRMVSYLRDDEVHLYSRTKGKYPGFEHIRDELICNLMAAPMVPDEFFGLPEDASEETLDKLRGIYANERVHLDGEIYLHGKSLRWISGQARREDDEKTLEYHVYDCFFPAAKASRHEMTSFYRQAYLDMFFEDAEKGGRECEMPHIHRVQNFKAKNREEVGELMERFVKEKYEGAIVRKNDAIYKYSLNNYHSSNLIKVKPIHDSEFEVVDYTQGKKGKDVGAVIWVCQVDPQHVINPKDVHFNVVPNISYKERYQIFQCLGEKVIDSEGKPVTRFERDIKGLPLTVRYPDRSTKTGKPVQAKAIAFRTYEEGPEADPIHQLLKDCIQK